MCLCSPNDHGKGIVGTPLVVLTVHQQLCAPIDGLTGDGVVGPAAVNTLSAGLNVFYPEVQRGVGGGGQRVVAGRGSREGPGEPLRRVGRAGAVEGDARSPKDHQRPVGESRRRADGRGHIFWAC